MSFRNKNILLVGGGTGGHFLPICALAKHLCKHYPDINVSTVGFGSQFEKAFFTELPNHHIIITGKLRRHITLKNFKELILFMIGFFQSGWLILRLRPALIFAKGGFVALPILIWARLFRIPFFLHESDTAFGLTNRINLKNAKKVFVGFPPELYPKRADLILSGPIISLNISGSNSETRRSFGFENDKPILLVTGGSQGSLSLNQAIMKVLPELLSKFNVIHQAGRSNLAELEAARSNLSPEEKTSYFLTDFLTLEGGNDRMRQAISLADVVISRAGANTMGELAVAGKAMILVPWKHSAADHQTKNAAYFAKKGAASIVSDDEDLAKNLLIKVKEIESNKELAASLRRDATRVLPRNGVEMVAREIASYLEGKK